MNKLIIIGNLTRAPEIRDVNGQSCCTFTVAVNRRVKSGAHPQADYVRVTAWGQLGEHCYNYLDKGRKVCVIGPVSAYGYIDNTGGARASLEMRADDVEFLTPKGQEQAAPDADAVSGEFTEVDDDELPFP